jgi:hypothetical protein
MSVVYNLQDYINIKNTNYSCILNDTVLNTILELENTIVTPDIKRHVIEKTNRKKVPDMNWEQVRNFKTTKLVISENNVDKAINEIRISLNKLSSKNIEKYELAIEETINKLLEITENKEQDLLRISNMIFEIASTNKIYSLMYACLYKNLLKKFPFLKQSLDKYLIDYRNNIKNLEYVNPDTDYNGYCIYNKNNDMRKASALFIINLLSIDIIDLDEVLDIIKFLQNLLIEYCQLENKKSEVEEIIENIFIITTNKISRLTECEEWESIIKPNIKNISNLKKEKTGKYPSITSRANFRCLDIIEAIF